MGNAVASRVCCCMSRFGKGDVQMVKCKVFCHKENPQILITIGLEVNKIREWDPANVAGKAEALLDSFIL